MGLWSWRDDRKAEAGTNVEQPMEGETGTIHTQTESGHAVQRATLENWPKRIPVKRIQANHGLPAWLVDEHQLTANVLAFEGFTGSRDRIHFPVKTNPSLCVLQILARLGVGADCASQLEINMAVFAGIKIRHISYNAPVQDPRVCVSLLTAGAKVVMDDPDTILEVEEALRGIPFEGRILLRVNLPQYVGYANEGDHQELMAHGHHSSKFGIPAEELGDVLRRMTLPVTGLHVHVGTQMDNMASFEHAIKSLHECADACGQHGHQISEINVGGGLGIPFDPGDDFPSLAHWCRSMSVWKNDRFRYSVEPGHALVGNAVALLTTIQAIKASRGRKWAIVDVGTDQLAKVTLLKWPHRILDETGTPLKAGKDAVAGPLCFAGDTLAENVDAGKLRKGAPLVITEAGAYTFSLANKFNGRTAPKWLLLQSGGEVVQPMEQEHLYDELQQAKYDWSVVASAVGEVPVDGTLIRGLSSSYLATKSKEDHFEYVEASHQDKRTYRFIVSTCSSVDFVSMPFAIRIMGDASIVSILHSGDFKEKRFPVWGRKLSMDCLDNVESNRPLEFTIALSETLRKGNQNVVIARFKTVCARCSGSFVISYEPDVPTE
jgi:diaminopimelate decarboxylase